MLSVAIVGCGKIADQHVQAIQRIPECKIVAVCDREVLMAKQLAERFHVPLFFGDLGELLRKTAPQVVHITTPPQGHFSLGEQCLQAGANVYIEKPFTVTATEAEKLIGLAERRGVKLTAGHNYQFTLEMLEMRRLVQQGFLGGHPVHLESHWSYDLGDISYVGPLLGNRNHWVRQLPGQLLHNLISHATARLAEFLTEPLVELTASAHQSETLARLGGDEVLDELRVLIRDIKGTTALLCFSTQIKPGLSQFRICGPGNSILVDQSSGSVLRNENRSYKSYLTYFVPPLNYAREHLRNAWRNVNNFRRRRLYQDFGMKELIERFYQHVRGVGPAPMAYREILLTARIMDTVFAQIYKTEEAHRQEAVLSS